MHAAVFNDGAPLHLLRRLTEFGPELDLILLEHLLEHYRHFHFVAVYIYAYCVSASATR
jgi:hypothetical protein